MDDETDTRVCVDCQREKPIDDFRLRVDHRGARRPYRLKKCRTCEWNGRPERSSPVLIPHQRGEAWRQPVELLEWPDTGCDLAPKCLECPLPVGCRYELPPAIARRIETAEYVGWQWQAGVSPQRIKDHLGISLRSVYRLKRLADAYGLPVLSS